MSPNVTKEPICQPTSLQEALNIIKFLTTSHKEEIRKLKEATEKQADVIQKLETTRKRELEFLSNELQKYEINLVIRTENVNKQLAEKDETIQKQINIIDELNKKLKEREDFIIPEINIVASVDSNSDSGVAMDNDDNHKSEDIKTETKTVRKCSRRFADSISFLRRVDFSPIKYKPCPREPTMKKKDVKKNSLEVPSKIVFQRQLSNDKSDDERPLSPDPEPVFSDSGIESFMSRQNKMSDSMNNHFSDDGSEDTSEEVFDRVMTRSSIRKSVKANPKYKKINRTKSKLLEQVKNNIAD